LYTSIKAARSIGDLVRGQMVVPRHSFYVIVDQCNALERENADYTKRDIKKELNDFFGGFWTR
jgi:hypothetical protein